MTKPTWTKKSYSEPPKAEVILCGMQDIITGSSSTDDGEWDLA